ncbi:MAG: dephospho-CoA kinase [Candidatus Loosdrechtia sp.]|uniref:dephospho-CoA kinase n=1 Tax=Candidatus Loosdrechtia sp. TaxID=3101272 RepID=UPI003A6BD0AB|nr:MAG: dephospho-CoA kinase [Candidatus Jettenia sp. AMX2]
MSVQPKIIGITGGIASGKSTIGRMLASLGAKYIDADEICHRLILLREYKNKITEKFGNAVQDASGRIDRSKLAAIVFQDKSRLNDLCSILHPPVIEYIRSKIEEAEKQGRRKAVVIDAALLEESDLSLLCYFIIFVNNSKEQRMKRSQTIRRWAAGELEKRERLQLSLEEKKKRADYIIDNTLTIENTFRQVKEFWKQYVEENLVKH